jgi:hypothetical protein
MDTPDLERLTILERAQLLHDATLRRHGEMLDRHEEMLAQHAANMRRLTEIQERQERLMESLAGIAAHHNEQMAELRQLLQAIKDMLDRGNGH